VRRITVALLGTLSSIVLLLAYPTSHNASLGSDDARSGTSGTDLGAAEPSPSTADPTGATGSKASTAPTGSTKAAKAYTGDAVRTRWGVVQVRITVLDGRITAARAVRYPNDNGHDQEVNSYALPILDREVLAAQSASVDAVSGATVTSDGYTESLQSALDAAHL
jgi:uncharacterized protein with FMN-binding domain